MYRIAAFFAACFATAALAQPYPHRPITLTVPFAAGGPTDTIARVLAERMSRSLGQTVVVENTAGAGGSIAVTKIMRAAPDGYSIGIGHLGTHVIAPAVQSITIDYLTELTPLGMVASNPQVIVSRTSVPGKDLKDLIAWVKANPNEASSGTGGPGTPSHISAVYFGNTVGTPLNIIHYKGSAPALQDVIAGHVAMTFDQAATALAQIKAGRVKAYAVTQKTRMPSAPDIPTTDEAGLPGFYMTIWHAFWGPKGMPRDVVVKLNASLKDALADPAVRKKLDDLGQEIPALEQQTPEALHAFHKSETEKWFPLIKTAGIKAQ
ncbi:MAG: tripartite tricarboxylate transporter substrate-binding protein [Usitatibacter sp.]